MSCGDRALAKWSPSSHLQRLLGAGRGERLTIGLARQCGSGLGHHSQPGIRSRTALIRRSSMAAVAKIMREYTSPPGVSHVAAATVPPGRVTRPNLAHDPISPWNELQDQHRERVAERGMG